MSTRNPFPTPGNKGRISHKRFAKKAKASDIRSVKKEAVLARKKVRSRPAEALSVDTAPQESPA